MTPLGWVSIFIGVGFTVQTILVWRFMKPKGKRRIPRRHVDFVPKHEMTVTWFKDVHVPVVTWIFGCIILMLFIVLPVAMLLYR